MPLCQTEIASLSRQITDLVPIPSHSPSPINHCCVINVWLADCPGISLHRCEALYDW